MLLKPAICLNDLDSHWQTGCVLVGVCKMTGQELADAKHLNPILIRQWALGNELPERALMVSPNHRVLAATEKTALYFEDHEVLVAAKHLTGLTSVDRVTVSGVTYIHFMFANMRLFCRTGRGPKVSSRVIHN